LPSPSYSDCAWFIRVIEAWPIFFLRLSLRRH
jgi:hypothetical protein